MPNLVLAQSRLIDWRPTLPILKLRAFSFANYNYVLVNKDRINLAIIIESIFSCSPLVAPIMPLHISILQSIGLYPFSKDRECILKSAKINYAMQHGKSITIIILRNIY